MKRDDAISTLLDIVRICRNNQHSYEMAAASSADPQLAALFRHYAMQREAYALQLADIIRSMGRYMDNSKGTSPTHAPVQLDVESPFKPDTEWAAIAHCEQGEAQALRCYLEALEFALPKQVLHVLEHQYEQTRITYANVSNLRDSTRFYLHTIKKLRGEYRNGKQEVTLQPSLYNRLKQ